MLIAMATGHGDANAWWPMKSRWRSPSTASTDWNWRTAAPVSRQCACAQRLGGELRIERGDQGTTLQLEFPLAA